MGHKTFYYAHQTVNRKEAREIELRIEKEVNIDLDNPFYDGDAIEVRELDATGKSSLNHYEITAVDLNKVRDSDGIVAFINVDKLAIGTCWEICECVTRWGKPVYVISSIKSVQEHPFFKHYGVQVFKNSYEFIKFGKAKWGSPSIFKLWQ